MNTELKFLLCGAGLFAPALNAAGQDTQPNILFIMADQWRKQAVGFMGEDPVQTPNLDALAQMAVAFDNAFSNNPVSGPNRACMLTGKYTINNGAWANNVPADPQDESSLGRLFKQAGYQTGYVGKWHINGVEDMVTDPTRRHGFDFWFQSIAHNHFRGNYYAPHISDKRFSVEKWGPEYETETAIEYLKSVGDKPFCLVVSYAPPHTGGGPGFEDRYQPGKPYRLGYGYAAPAQYEKLYQDDYAEHLIRPNILPTGNDPRTNCYAHAVPGYFGAITSIDEQVGRLVEYLRQSGKLENTIIVFTADHGEMMGSHGLMTKGVPFEESVGVPMIIAWKGKIAPARQHCVINSIDLLPTLLGLAQLQIPASTDGTNYAPLLLGEKFNTPKYAFAEFNFGGVGEACRPWRAVFSEDFVYILAGECKFKQAFAPEGYVLFDRKKDPYQMHPITRSMGYDEVIDRYHAILKAHLEELGDQFLTTMWHTPTLPSKPTLNKENVDPNWNDDFLQRKQKRDNRK